MAFVTGSAADFDAIKSAIISACTGNGWTLTDGILHKGDCYVSMDVFAYVNDAQPERLQFRMGTGQSGGVLSSPTPLPAGDFSSRYKICALRRPVPAEPIVWPATYYLMVVGDEVYLHMNWGVDKWIGGGFGVSPIATGFTGAGNWLSFPTFDEAGTGFENPLRFPNGLEVGGQSGGRFQAPAVGLFTSYNRYANGFVRHDVIDDVPKWSELSGTTGVAYTHSGFRNPWGRENPATNWNNQAGLFPIQPAVLVADSKLCIVAELQWARYVRIDNLTPGQILTFGTDRWMVFPWYKKDAVDRQPLNASGVDHSGTYGHAIYYDGP